MFHRHDCCSPTTTTDCSDSPAIAVPARRAVRRMSLLTAILGAALFATTTAMAADGTGVLPWPPETFLQAILGSVAFGLVGIVLAIAGFKLFDAATPFSLEKEICEKGNLAVAIVCAAMILGICLIISKAMS